MSRQRSDLVFGFLANEVKLMERAKAYGLVADLPPRATSSGRSFQRSRFLISSFGEFGSATIYVSTVSYCFSLPLRYASKRYRTPEIVAQIKLLAKLIETEFPPSLYRAVSADVPNDLKGQKLPPALANYRIEDLPF